MSGAAFESGLSQILISTSNTICGFDQNRTIHPNLCAKLPGYSNLGQSDILELVSH